MPRPVKGSSDRAFGVTFAVVCTLIGFWPWVAHGRGPHLWAFALALLFAGAAFFMPRVLAPLNRVWLWFGLVLHGIVNPVIMALLYYAAVVPMGLVLKLMGKDLLRLRRDRSVASHWVRRDPPGPTAASMTKQF